MSAIISTHYITEAQQQQVADLLRQAVEAVRQGTEPRAALEAQGFRLGRRTLNGVRSVELPGSHMSGWTDRSELTDEAIGDIGWEARAIADVLGSEHHPSVPGSQVATWEAWLAIHRAMSY